VCGNLWAGGTTGEQVEAIRQVEPQLTVTQVRSFVAISVQTFCPDIAAHYIQR